MVKLVVAGSIPGLITCSILNGIVFMDTEKGLGGYSFMWNFMVQFL